MSMNDVIELIKKIKVSGDFPLDIEILKNGFIECVKITQSSKVPEGDIAEVSYIVNALTSKGTH